jgi:chromosome partitioning protein
MILTVCSFKGGVGKTTTAIHLAGYFQTLGPTLLVDADANRSAMVWGRGGKLPFRVVDERQAPRAARDIPPEHTIIDTAARPDRDVVQTLAESCDFLVVPTTPDALSIAALLSITDTLKELGASRWRVLLTMVPPAPNSDGATARAQLVAEGLPLFAGSVRRTVAFPRAALAGVLVGSLPTRQGVTAAAEYKFVAEEIPR